jgi:hypothetical protein
MNEAHLYHVPSTARQDRMLAELRRVLRPGGLLAGTDGVETPARRELHVDDDYLPIDPATLAGRLAAAGSPTPRSRWSRTASGSWPRRQPDLGRPRAGPGQRRGRRRQVRW